MTDMLTEIITTKSKEVTALKQDLSIATLEKQIKANDEDANFPQVRRFIHSIESTIQDSGTAVIAEIKKASPSKGLIREDFDPIAIAKSYQQGGAACLSVLTDVPYFQGHADYLLMAKTATNLPVLRKDFIIDPWQIFQSRVLGADCVLLIAACLNDAQLMEMTLLSRDLGMDVLMEVHDAEELERALKTPAQLIGVNNRNLKTFDTDLATSESLVELVDESRILVSESGIHTAADVKRLKAAGIHCFLIGESLMRKADPGAQLRNLVG